MTKDEAKNRLSAFDHVEEEVLCEAAPYMAARPLAIIIRQRLPNCETGRMTQDQKAFWMAFGEVLGPDWLASFHHISGFMKKMNEF